MRLEYYNTVDDIVAFNLYACASSIRNSRIRCALYVSIPSIVASMFIPVPYGQNGRIIIMLIASVVAFALSATFYVLVPIFMGREVRRLLSIGQNKGIVGFHALEISSEGLLERTEISESRYPWHAVERIDDTERYTYVFFSALMAHVIPKRNNVTVVNEFVMHSRNYWAEAQANVSGGAKA